MDSKNHGAPMTVIITTSFPKAFKADFGLYRGVWLCSPLNYISVTRILRFSLLNEFKAKVINDRRGEEGALEAIFDYVTSPAFASRVQLIYENSTRINEQVKKMRASRYGLTFFWYIISR